ncbi:MAG: hypothetical protein IT169_11195 [Bryobacterales bacterium]|nr:hypothetical protein [Bryobacterales bacterium]
MNRREFLAAPLLAAPAFSAPAMARRYHVCLSSASLERNPELIDLVKQAGVHTIWLTGFLYGHWYYEPARIAAAARRIRKAGMEAEIAFVPLGHPGDSLGDKAGEPPLIPPPHWRQCVHADGSRHWGTSLHAPAAAENAAALARLDGMVFRTLFLDDDFRLATGPGQIGGCFCDDHWRRFSEAHGYGAGVREQLIADIQARSLSPELRAWVEFHCSELTACFRRLQRARKGLTIGNMVMYLGAEKAGIRLNDYRGVPFRVGELMFSDREFDRLKGKTDELFSTLFHRRFATPELAYSETTAFPADKLSASNMAAKLAISTLADVRNTMMMSGLTPFPVSHWQVLAPAMRRQAEIHAEVAGHAPAGPFKHYWGEHSRYVGDDKPYSLFLASGIPFEVCNALPSTGWAFLSDADAAAQPRSPGVELVTRRDTPETMEEIFALKQRLFPRLGATPFIEEEQPAVCAWYPTARRALVWNLSNEPRAFTLRHENRRLPLRAAALELVSVPL